MDIYGLLRNQWQQGEPYRAALGGLLYGDVQPAMSLLNAKSPVDPNEAVNAAMTFAPIGIGAINAYHGSPHKFDKFDMSKIGTGEGAQAYGHGLYFADNPEVANSYKQSNSSTAELAYNNKPITDELKKSVAWHLEHFKGDKQAVLDYWKQSYKPAYWESAQGKKELKLLDEMDYGKLTSGNMYQVSLQHPDPAKEAATPLAPEDFLQWDKPLSEQPEYIQDIAYSRGMHKIHPSARLTMNGDAYSPVGEPTGADLYNRISEIYGSVGGNGAYKATTTFSKLGIPGIRYLDGNSRSNGQGTYNYVIFDPEYAKIISRNGGLLGGN